MKHDAKVSDLPAALHRAQSVDGGSPAIDGMSVTTLPLVGGERHADVQKLELVVVEGPLAGRRFTTSAERCAIGQAAANDVVIDDPAVSRFHSEIALGDEGLSIRDLGSRNGTWVSGVSVRDALLRDGQVLQLGRTFMRVVLSDEVERQPLAEHFGRLRGRSRKMRGLFAQLARVADTRSTVLLEGETGTGKTAAAESLHLESPRRGGPFLVVDCGAVPGALLESELFGHEKGAFTGAVGRRVGAFEAASGGTLFLDKIGELPLELQPKLLRALESRAIKPIGENTSRTVDVRVIAASNRDLRADVNAGRFRADLYYRLAVFTLRMPALRERREDIAELVAGFVDELAPPAEARARVLAPEHLARLAEARWPGNVRELRNYVERSLVFAAGELEEAVAMSDVRPGLEAPDVWLDRPYAEARQQALDEFERRYVRALLERSGGRVTAAARDAGLHRAYLHRLINRHGLSR